MTITRIVVPAFACVLFGASAALAGHDHYVQTPGVLKDNVAKGQTAINDPEHGGYHQFHERVHTGVPGAGVTPNGKKDGVGTTNDRNPVGIGKSSDL